MNETPPPAKEEEEAEEETRPADTKAGAVPEREASEQGGADSGPEAETVRASDLRREANSGPQASAVGKNLAPYHVMARVFAQGGLSGLAGAIPVTFFFLVEMLLGGVPAPGLPEFVGVFVFFVVVGAVWGAALSAVEEFARRAGRSMRRMVVLSLGFPLFATAAVLWISGVSEGGPEKGFYLLQTVLKELASEFRSNPIESFAVSLAMLVPFLGLLLVRRWQGEHEGKPMGSLYYGSSALLGLACALCVVVANLRWGSHLELGSVLLGFSATAALVTSVAWGLVAGRIWVEGKLRRYEAWANAD